MVIKFDEAGWKPEENFKGGEGTVYMNMVNDGLNKILLMKIPAGCSTGLHKHEGSSEIIYILEGEGKTWQDGALVPVSAGMSAYCPEGEQHQMVNDSDKDLIFFAVIPTQERKN